MLLPYRSKAVLFALAWLLSACSTTEFFSASTACVVPLNSEDVAELNATGNSDSVWKREENALSIRVVTPSDLNRLERFPLGTAVGFYQMSKPENFVKEIATKSGIRRLLLLENLDASILQYDVQSLQPKSSNRFDIARVERAKYVGLIVGYHNLSPDQSVRLIRIPLVRTHRSQLNPVNWFTDPPPAMPAKLDVLISLGSEEVEDVVINVHNECQS